MLSERGTHPARASGVQSAVGLPAKKTNGSAHADKSGTRSTQEACVQPASTNGLKRNASLAADGRRTRFGTRTNGVEQRSALRGV